MKIRQSGRKGEATLRAQGAAEYLVILAIVLVIVLLVIGLLNGSLDSTTGSQVKESGLYWATVNPISIVNHNDGVGAGFFSVVLKNNNGRVIYVHNVSILAPNGVWGGWQYGDYIAPGGVLWVPITHQAPAGSNNTEVCLNSQYYQFLANITYTVVEFGTVKTEVGQKPLVGECGGWNAGNRSGTLPPVNPPPVTSCNGAQSVCGQFCCAPGRPCCGNAGVCCPRGWNCVSGECLNPGTGEERDDGHQ